MRELGVLPDAFQARALADYLLTLRIETRLEQQAEGCVLWVCDEDRVAEARKELEAFRQEPRAARYAAAGTAAEAIRQEEDEVEEAYNRRQTELREMMAEPQKPRSGWPFTIFLVVVAILISFVTRYGEDKSQAAMQALFIAPFRVFDETGKSHMIEWPGLDRIYKHGEVWRVVTPMLLHFEFFHLLFNVIMLVQLGGAFEERRGTWRYILFIVVVSAVSNLSQYYLGWTANISRWSTPGPNPQFGGLSGVNYGLFGYVWMKSRYEPELGFIVSPTVVICMIGWFLLCFTGAVGPIANVAHAAGLAVGMLVGVTPTLWRRCFGRRGPTEPIA